MLIPEGFSRRSITQECAKNKVRNDLTTQYPGFHEYQDQLQANNQCSGAQFEATKLFWLLFLNTVLSRLFSSINLCYDYVSFLGLS